ncbi:hypothetical protein CLOP_g21935 [Closterium sp. NIES-67]|nr:hypothetical protein CLOP_g21935 [Closterium sp. NIES-67]
MPSRSPSPRRQRSPAPRSRSRSPGRPGSPVRSPARKRSLSRSPVRGRSRSPIRRRSRSPVRSPARSRSRSPRRRSRSPIKGRSRSPPFRRGSPRMRSPPPRSPGPDDESRNPGNNLYVTGLSMRTTEVELEKHFSKEGKVAECRLVLDPRTKDSRGFAFVTMDNVDDARRCLKYLDRSILDGRVITVALAKRKRARTPTPGKFLGTRSLKESVPGVGGDRSFGGEREFNPRRSSPDYQPYRRDRSPDYGPYRGAGYR